MKMKARYFLLMLAGLICLLGLTAVSFTALMAIHGETTALIIVLVMAPFSFITPMIFGYHVGNADGSMHGYNRGVCDVNLATVARERAILEELDQA